MRVIAEDKVDIRASGWYRKNGAYQWPFEDPLPDLISTIASGIEATVLLQQLESHNEYTAISTQLTRNELWIKQIAERVGLKLPTE